MTYLALPHTSVDFTEVRTWLEPLMGTPLRIIIIVLVASIILAVLRRFIKNLTERIATGESVRSVRKLKSGNTDLSRALGLGSPLASARKSQRARTIGSVLRSTVTLIVGLIGTLMVLEQLGINTVPLMTSAGVAGVALGFGAQSLVKDFLSGTFMILEDQFGVGDRVIVGEVFGTVEEVALRITKVRDEHGTLWFLRNGEMLRVGNYTQGWAMASLEIPVPYTSDLAAVRTALANAIDVVSKNSRYSAVIMGTPQVSGIEVMTATAVTLKVSARTQPAQQWEIARVLREEIRDQFERDGLVLAE